MPYSTKAVANLLLDLAKDRSLPVSPMKLQKLLFFAHGWHLALANEPLLDEPVEAWQYGPVIDSLYHAFKHCGTRPISGYATEFDIEDLQDITPVLSDSDKAQVGPLLNEVLDVYGKFSAVQLSNMTHEPGTPWDDTWRATGGLRRNADIDDAKIKAYFLARRKSQS